MPASLLGDAVARLARRPGRHGLVACFPKSGSTYTVDVIRRLLSIRSPFFYRASGYEEQNLDERKLRKHLWHDTVTQQHVPGTPGNLRILEKYGVRTVVLVRNLFDVCVSLYDHFHGESEACGEAYLNRDFFGLAEEEQRAAIIDLVIPWYFKFYVSWWDASAAGAVPILWVRYEELIDDKESTFRRMLDHFGWPCDLARLRRLLDEKPGEGTRFNRGVSGRGQALLSRDERQRIRRLCAHYPSVDFSRIGLPGEADA
jgi:hypothetical protein